MLRGPIFASLPLFLNALSKLSGTQNMRYALRMMPFVVLMWCQPTAIQAEEILQVELSYYKQHRAFHEPLYLKLSIKNIGESKVVLPEPKTDIQFKMEYQTNDHDALRHLTFREIHPSGGFGGSDVPEFELEPMQQANFYWFRFLPAFAKDNQYYWGEFAQGSRLNLTVTYYPRQMGKQYDPRLPKLSVGSMNHFINGDNPEDLLLFDRVGQSQDEEGESLKLLGHSDARMSASRLKSMHGQFSSAECNNAVELLLKLQAVRHAVGSEQLSADEALEEFLYWQPEIKRQALMQYVLHKLPDRCEELKKRLIKELAQDKIRPVEHFEK